MRHESCILGCFRKYRWHAREPSRGLCGVCLRIDLHRVEGGAREALVSVTTNGDGRVDGPLLADDAFTAGRYELVFHAAAYLRAGGTALPDTPFLDEIVIAFGIDNADQHYHVPLLLSPYGYSTYRGS